MPTRIQTVLIDGGAKTSKSTVGTAICEALARYKHVAVGDAGRFVRQVTFAALEALGVDGREDIADADLDRAIKAVVQAETAFDENYIWGNLESPEINRWVSVVGKRPAVQQQKMDWYGALLHRARQNGDEVLVINARNPRSHLKKWAGELELKLEIFTDCDPKVAAVRKLLGHGVPKPSPDLVEKERLAIIERRELDLTRPTDTFVVPKKFVPYDAGGDVQDIIAKSRKAPADTAPLPILFDTSDMSKPGMERAAQQLALAALGLPLI